MLLPSWPPGPGLLGVMEMFGSGSNRRALVGVATVVALSATVVAMPVAFAVHRYSDVPDGSIYAQAVERLGAAGMIKGCGDGTAFCPQDEVTRGQLALLLDRMSGKGDVGPSVDAATVMGMTPEQLRGQIGPQGPQGPQGETGPQGPHGLVAGHERGAEPGGILLPVSLDRTLVAMELPAGDWMITGNVQFSLRNSATAVSVLVECSMKTPELVLTGGYETVEAEASREGVRRLALTTTTTLTVPTTVELVCKRWYEGEGDLYSGGSGTNVVAVQLTSRTSS